MFDDEKNEVSDPSVKAKTGINLADLKKMYATRDQSAAHMEIKLCYSGKNVYVRPMKVKDKKDILKAVETKNDTVLNRLLDELVEKYVEAEDKRPVLTGDLTQKEKEQIIVYMRLAVGDLDKTINIAHECPQCKQIAKDIPFSLDAMSVTEYNKDDRDVVAIFDGKIRIKMGPITLNDERAIEENVKKKKLTATSDKQLVTVAALIKRIYVDNEPSDVVTLDDKVSFLEQLALSDLQALTGYLERYDFGVKLPFDFKCAGCGFKGEQEANPAVFFMS